MIGEDGMASSCTKIGFRLVIWKEIILQESDEALAQDAQSLYLEVLKKLVDVILRNKI